MDNLKQNESKIQNELFERTLNNLSQKYKNKRVLLYGAGLYFDTIADNYDLKKFFNIVGISDLKFEATEEEKYKHLDIFKPSELKKDDIDVILVTAVNFAIISTSLAKLGIPLEHVTISTEGKILEIQNNYQNVLKRIKKKDKLKIVFLINETAKWQYQSLYEAMEQDPHFEPLVLVTPLISIHNGNDDTRESLTDLYNFFKKRNINVEYAYDEKKKEYLDLEQFEPDVVFYQQPWFLSIVQDVFKVSNFALTCYCPYAISESSFIFKWTEDFCRFLHKHFVVDKSAKNQYLEHFGNINNIEIVGHPKLDDISQVLKNYSKKSDKKTIIYAPHHSFEEVTLKWATFEWSGFEVLKMAKENPQFNWILKPHPRMKYKLIVNNIMSEKEIDNYFNDWQKTGTVVEGGSYFELFAESDLMITDCGSFLVEYFITQKPLIHLLRKDAQEQSLLNQQILECYHSAKNAKELKFEFEQLMFKNIDTLKQSRKEKLNELNFQNSTSKIMKHLTNIRIK